MIITDRIIFERYHALLQHCQSIISHWHIQPAGIAFTNRKGVYGLAHPHGGISINNAFLGTDAIAKLDQTILHELAHLAAGLHNGHNDVWRGIAQAIGMQFEAHCTDGVRDNISYKYTVFAHCTDGSCEQLGGVHRKTKKWADYAPKPGAVHRLKDGRRIARYEFIEN